jgi:hypothetical protein
MKRAPLAAGILDAALRAVRTWPTLFSFLVASSSH